MRLQNKKYIPAKVESVSEETLAEPSVEALQRENMMLKSACDAFMVKVFCLVCMEVERSQVTRPCLHVVLCKDCASAISTCPVCSVKVDEHETCYLI